ncbi:MAG: rod shape-determining protein MreD [Nocardioidaceae bacterium]|nr:MAG: rod shape-determining protein MreD [Nocardioidaceae bacterium]
MTLLRGLGYLALLVIAFVVQVTFFSAFTVQGIGPNLVLLVVVSAGLARGPELAMGLGFTGGLLLDLAPPADHVAGRWALCLVVVGFLIGRLRARAQGATPIEVIAVVAVASFVASSLFVFTGFVLGDTAWSANAALRVILIGLAYDCAVAPFLMPLLGKAEERLSPPQVGLA